jgi:TonB family protein
MTAQLLPFLVLVATALASDPSGWNPTRITSLQYPALGLQAQLQGGVVLRLRLDPLGNVSSVEIVSGHPVLAGAARDNIKTWKFGKMCNNDKSSEPAELEFNYECKLEGVVKSNPKTDFVFEHPNKITLKSSAVHWTP